MLPLVAWACLFFCFLDTAQVSVGWLLFLRLCGVALGPGRMRGLVRWRKCRSMWVVVYSRYIEGAVAEVFVGLGSRVVGFVLLGEVAYAWF